MIKLNSKHELDSREEYSIGEYVAVQGFCKADKKNFFVMVSEDGKFLLTIDEAEMCPMIDNCFCDTFRSFLNSKHGVDNYEIKYASKTYPDLNCEVVF